jgi:hypothetical protein
MKCVTEYNINSIEHFTFVVNGEFRYGLIKVKIYPTTSGMLLVTQLRFVNVIKLMKVNYKCECPSMYLNLKASPSCMFLLFTSCVSFVK